MSDGTINFPERITHPSTPSSDRVVFYIFDDGVNKEPYYKLDDGSENTLKGDQGDVGPQGPIGPQGVVGPQGPAGPMSVEAFVSETVTVTLPNTATKTLVYSNSVTVSTTGDLFLDVSLAVRPHSTGNDVEFDVRFNGVILSPDYAEEHKDISAAQSVWRSQCISLGNVAAGTYNLELFFSKETTGGTAQLKNYTAKIVRYS